MTNINGKKRKLNMKYTTDKEQRDFFQKAGRLELAGLISPKQLEEVNKVIDEALVGRLGISPDKWYALPASELFMRGRDLWRDSPALKKFVSQPRFTEIAADLMRKKPIRLGYDQLLPSLRQRIGGEGEPYSTFMNQTTTLENISSLRGILGGLMICLSSSRSESDAREEDDPFPIEAGNVLFLSPQAPISLKQLHKHPGQRYYLILYTQELAHYQLQPQDPHVHGLKQLGYTYEDKLSDVIHPIIYR